jgi:diguanylate cyclase (GGDEF)-like protein/PAS domain S-box-containing protein
LIYKDIWHYAGFLYLSKDQLLRKNLNINYYFPFVPSNTKVSEVRSMTGRNVTQEEPSPAQFNLHELAPLGYCTVSERGLILEANLSVATLLGVGREELIKQPFTQFVLDEDQGIYSRYRDQLVDNGGPQACELRMVKRGGAAFLVHLEGVTAQAHGEEASVCIMEISDAPERQRGEEALRQSKEMFQAIADCTVDWESWFGPDGKYLWVNPAVEKITGYSAQAVLAMPDFVSVLIAEEDRPAFRAWFESALRGSQGENVELRCQHKDGFKRWLDVSWQRICDAHGNMLGTRVSGRDITDRKRAEKALAESEALLNRTQRLSKTGGWEWDIDQQTMTWTAETYRLHGYTADCTAPGSFQLIEKSLLCYRPEDRDRILQAFRRCAEEGEPYDFELPFSSPFGTAKWVRTTAEALRNGDRIVKVVGNLIDITERKQAETALRESESFKEVILDSVAAEITVVDRTGIIRAVNERWRHFALENGVGPGERAKSVEVGANYLAVCAADHDPMSQQIALDAGKGIRAVLDGALPSFSLEYPCHSPQQQRWFSMVVMPLGPDASDGVVITHTDITALKQAEQALAENEGKLKLFIQHAPVGLAMFDLEMRYLYASNQWLANYALGTRDLRGCCHYEVFPEIPDEWKIAHRRGLAGEVLRSEGDRFERLDGSVQWVRWEIRPWNDAQGRIGGIVIFTEDITAHRVAEESLRAAQVQLESMTSAVPGVVYQFLQSPAGDWKFTYLSKGLNDLYEVTPEDGLRDHNVLTQCILPEHRVGHKESVDRSAATLTLWVNEHIIRTPSGKLKWVRGQALPQRQDDGSVFWNGILVDISERKQMEDALREQEEFFRLITENLEGFIAVLDIDGRRLYASPSYERLLGRRELSGTSSFADIHPSDSERVIGSFRETVATGIGHHLEFRFMRADGGICLLESRSGVIRDHEGRTKRVVVVSHDVTERKAAEDKIHHLAFHDALTQLPNRLTLKDRLSQTLAVSKRRGCYGALMFIDLDKFKLLNDTHGHEAGDLLLIEVADRLKRCLREVDTVARFGGDEFVVMLPELNPDKTESTSQASLVAEKVSLSLSEPYRLTLKREKMANKTIEHRCTASIGVALFIDHECSQDDILKWADAAMYEAKNAGRNLIRFHK